MEYEENEEELSLIEDRGSSYEDIDEVNEHGFTIERKLEPVVGYVKEFMTKAEDARRNDEERWSKAYNNYRGIYGPDVVFREDEKSRVFIKVTKSKVMAAYGQIMQVLTGGGKFPLSIEPTKLPDGIADNVAIEPDSMNEQETEVTVPSSLQLTPAIEKELEGLNAVAGIPKSDKGVLIEPARLAASKMQKKIDDQLMESHAFKHLRSSAFELCLFGTGVIKGPFAIDKEYPKWDDEGEYDPLTKTIPQISHTSVWNLYPDPDANFVDEATGIVERHKMSAFQLRNLNNRPFFRENVIEEVIRMGPDYQRKWWEDNLEDYEASTNTDRFEVLEYWGILPVGVLKQDYEIAEELEDFHDTEEVQINAWVAGDRIIRLVLNPFKPVRIPYHVVPFEMNPYSFFGIGVAENMDDTQTLMNGFIRLAVDNAVLSGNIILEVDETNLTPGQDLSKVHPGMIIRREGGPPGQALFGTNLPNISGEIMQMFDHARRLSDESTGIPSFSHGQTGVTGIGRTAAGISMLMGAAEGTVKSVISNIDDYLIKPLGDGLYHFNMQFDHDPDIKGDLEVKARGTESLIASEVRSQRLLQLLSIGGGNPQTAVWLKIPYIMGEIAKTLGLDSEKVINSTLEAMKQAKMQQEAQVPQGGAGGGGSAPAGTPAGQGVGNDPSGGGGGNIGVGGAAAPNTEGFSGNVQQ